MVSMVAGILGVTILPLIGSVVAVATGHAALGQIRESGGRLDGRPMAKAGIGLGYFYITLFVFILAMIFLYLPLREDVMRGSASATVVTTPAPAVANSEAGVKMVNEMDQADYHLIGNFNLNNGEGEIIACYNAGKDPSNPELALLTTHQIIYLKDAKTTSFNLKDVTGLKDDDEYRQNHIHKYFYVINYIIEITSGNGQRMRIVIRPKIQGSAFYEAIQDALKQAGVTVPKG